MTDRQAGDEADAADEGSQSPAPGRLVWDLPLRLFHWLLALSFLASWLSGRAGYDFRPVHMWLGYWMLGLLSFRLAWGFVGPRHARFTRFAPRPRALSAYVRSLLDGTARESIGHNPLGGLMVFAMLILLALQAGTGLFVFDDIMYGGPYHDAVSSKTAELLADLHHSVVNVIVVLVLIHIAAVLYYTLRKKQRLVRAMLTGRKDALLVPPGEAIPGSRIWLAIAMAAIAAAFVYWLVFVAPA